MASDRAAAHIAMTTGAMCPLIAAGLAGMSDG
jgi:hypothetical protein